MATRTQTDVTDTTSEWGEGTLTGTEAANGGLQLSAQRILYRHNFPTLGGWVNVENRPGSLSIVDGLGHEGKLARSSGETTWVADRSVLIPYDPAKIYMVSARVRKTNNTDNTGIYIGLEGVDSDGTTMINSNGEDNGGSQHYYAASNYKQNEAEDWKTFRGFVSGTGTKSDINAPANDPTNPGPMYNGTAYIRPLLILAYDNTTTDVCEVDYVEIRELSGGLANHALNEEGTPFAPLRNGLATYLTDGDRNTNPYVEPDDTRTDVDNFVTVDLGELKPICQIGVWHYYSDNRSYHRTGTMVCAGTNYWHQNPTPELDYSQWAIGTSGTQANFSKNGDTAENHIIRCLDPFGIPTAVWECRPDSDSDSDGGWNADFAHDDTKTIRLSVFVRKRFNLADGSTYMGCSQDTTENLDGTENTNPYFWSGDLPALDEWYLMVGYIHPAGYSGGNTGISGVYDMGGNQVISGDEYRAKSGATTQTMRAYLYYCTDTTSRQDFCYPRVDVVDGTEPLIRELTNGAPWRELFDSVDAGEYSETSEGKWHGMETEYIRYIRDRLRGNTENTGDHWVEIEAYGEPAMFNTGTRTRQLTLSEAGRISSTSISWSSHQALMCGLGTLAFVDGVDIPGIDEVTVEAWVYVTGPSSMSDRGCIITDSECYYMQVMDDGRIAFYTYWDDGGTQGNSSYTYSSGTIGFNKWHHIAATKNSAGEQKIYIDGALDTTVTKETGLWTPSGRVACGTQYNDDYSRAGAMAIREARVWSIVRTQSEIQDGMWNPPGGEAAGLELYWPLDEGSGDVANDVTGSHPGTIIDPRWLTTSVETNVSLDGGSTWAGWKTVTNGGSIPDIPADSDGREVVVDCRQTLNAPYAEASPFFHSLTIEATGSRAIAKYWDGSQWVEQPFKTWDGSQWVTPDLRVYTEGRWL